MQSLVQSTEAYIKKHAMIQPGQQLLVAVSGGVDSVALCHLLIQLEYRIAIAHCNFGLRGASSDKDQDFVERLAEKLGIKCFTRKFAVGDHMSNHGGSTQMAARSLRYDWFRELMEQEGYDLLATAHHANDQIETMVFNLTKGTSIAGLRGIKPKSNNTIRPLLFASKEEILAYASSAKLKWREDKSNQEDKYQRNKIRHHIIPVMTEINPGLIKTSLNNTSRFHALEKLLNHQIELIRNHHFSETTEGLNLDLSWCEEDSGGLAILEGLLKPYGINLEQCQCIMDGLGQNSGLTFQSDTHLLTLDRSSAFISTIKAPDNFRETIDIRDNSKHIGGRLFTFELVTGRPEIDPNPNFAYLDAYKVNFPLVARNWQEGDRFQPLGMKGEKKVSDFMIDEKIPVNLKKRLVIFESQHDILWIAGHRISDRYKITSKTPSTLIIKMIHDAEAL